MKRITNLNNPNNVIIVSDAYINGDRIVCITEEEEFDLWRNCWKLEDLPEQPVEGLEEEIKRMVYDVVYDLDGPAIKGTSEYLSVEDVVFIARHFAEWGARHSINWGDVQLLDTFILELSREEKDGTDWGDSEKFYTEVLRRFHEFNDKKISEIVAEWGAEHARKEDK